MGIVLPASTAITPTYPVREETATVHRIAALLPPHHEYLQLIDMFNIMWTHAVNKTIWHKTIKKTPSDIINAVL